MGRKCFEIYLINDDGSKYPEFLFGVDSGETEKEAVDHFQFVQLGRLEKWNKEDILVVARLIVELNHEM